ncbi:MAG TPA: YbaB/EbfC family nucleoid-associated protein [Candidatus Kapabacteria bacterium]|nr:YbaB/EbfC family nucleoid-associated protein [Candidatus Kapabacteria bacterium]
MNFDFKNIFEQFKKVQSEMEAIKSELEHKTVIGESGGGMVIVEMSGNQKLRKINISDELMNTNDKSMISDLIVAAVNNAFKQASDLSQSELGKLQNMMPNIPGLNFNL